MEFFLKKNQKSRAGGCSRKCSFGDFDKSVGVDLGTCGFQSPAKGGCVGTQVAKVTCMFRAFSVHFHTWTLIFGLCLIFQVVAMTLKVRNAF